MFCSKIFVISLPGFFAGGASAGAVAPEPVAGALATGFFTGASVWTYDMFASNMAAMLVTFLGLGCSTILAKQNLVYSE